MQLEKDTAHSHDKLGTQCGYWVPGPFNGNLPGHFDFEDYGDVSTVVRGRHENGQLKFGKNQVGTKYDALTKLQSADKQRAEAKMACVSTQQLLSLAGRPGGSAASCGSERDVDCLSARQPMLPDSDSDGGCGFQ